MVNSSTNKDDLSLSFCIVLKTPDHIDVRRFGQNITWRELKTEIKPCFDLFKLTVPLITFIHRKYREKKIIAAVLK